MTFDSIKKYLSTAASRYNLNNQISASLVCQRFRKLIAQKYSNYEESWQPKKFVDGVLYIKSTNSAASAQIFMQRTFLLEQFAQDEVLRCVKKIQIIK